MLCSSSLIWRRSYRRVASELAGGSKLTQFVSYHILSNVYGHMLAAVMDSKGVADEFGEDGGGAAPVLTTLFLPASFIASTFFIRESAT